MVKHIYHLTHNLKVAGSNPAPATIVICTPSLLAWGCLFFCFVPSFIKAATCEYWLRRQRWPGQRWFSGHNDPCLLWRI